MNDAELVTTAEAAKILGRSVATVNRWAKSGRLEVAEQYPGPTGPRLFRRSTVEAAA
jgi:excisionase family DNA binding protein